MQVIEVVVMRACVAMCVLATVGIYMEQDMEYFLLYQVIVAFTLWIVLSALFGILKPSKILTDFVNSVFTLVVFNLIVTFDDSHVSKAEKLFMLDNVKPFIQHQATVNWALRESLLLINFFRNLMLILKVSAIRFAVYIAYLSCHAVVLIVLLELLVTAFSYDIVQPLSEHMRHKFDIKDYPAGYNGPLDLNVSYQDRNVQEIRTYNQDFEGKYQLKQLQMNSNIRVNERNVYLPLLKQYIKRYHGEDLTLDCSNSFNLKAYTSVYWSVRRTSIRWTFNGTDVSKGPRHERTYNITMDADMVYINASLKIKLIRARDIGVYRCFLYINYYKQQLGSSRFNLHVETDLIGIFSLNSISQRIKIVRISVGDIISTNAFYHSKEDTYDIDVDYTINNIPTGTLSHSNECSIASRIYISFLTKSLFIYSKFHHVEVKEAVPSIKLAIVMFCLGNDMFGIHRVVFYRRVHTARNNITFYELEHPFVLVVLPSSQYSILWNFDDEMLYNDIENMVKNGTNLDIIQYKLDAILAFINANEKRGLVLTAILHVYVLGHCILFLFVILHISFSVYFKYVIMKPARLFLIPMKYRDEQLLAIENIGFDVFVSHAEDQYDFVTTILLPFLQEKHYTVSYSRDEINCPPNQPVFHFYKETIPTSKKIIVVLSKHFTEDNLCNHVQLELIILPLLYEKKIEPKNVLFIKYDKHAVLPVILRWNLEVETLSWHNHLSDAVKLRSVGLWLATGKCRI